MYYANVSSTSSVPSFMEFWGEPAPSNHGKEMAMLQELTVEEISLVSGGGAAGAAIGSIAGGIAGAAYGADIGGAAGVLVGGLVGGPVGAYLGGVAGAYLGGAYGDTVGAAGGGYLGSLYIDIKDV